MGEGEASGGRVSATVRGLGIRSVDCKCFSIFYSWIVLPGGTAPGPIRAAVKAQLTHPSPS
jgi:hypothetical protein